MKPIILIKIGGSLITDKSKPYTLKEKALHIICEEIKKAQSLNKQLIIGHGGGSFAHVPAKKYQTQEGLKNEGSLRGVAEVANAAAKLNRIVINKMLEVGINALSVSPLSIMVADNKELKDIFSESIEQLLDKNLLPVLYGDQVMDKKTGCTIFSTEKVLGYVAMHLKEKGYQIERIIHCGKTNGVYDVDGNTVEMINSENFNNYKESLDGSSGVDVTGGMIHKVEETLKLAQKGIPGLIIDGIEHGSLSSAIKGEPVIGTKIEK